MRVAFSEIMASDANRSAFQELKVTGVPAYTIGGKLVAR